MSAPEPPKLLLDTNVYVDLADGKLPAEEKCLRKLASHRTPPLFWTCRTVFEELTGHIHRQNASKFGLYRTALKWMDDLCGNGGTAEDLAWILSQAVFAEAQPYEDARRSDMGFGRRFILRASRFDELSQKVTSALEAQRADHLSEVERWVTQMETFGQMLKVPRQPGELTHEAKTVIPEGIVDMAIKTAVEYHGFWGKLYSREEIRERQREFIAFELAFVLNCGGKNGYNVRKHSTDYNDALLCRYPSAGYTLVTSDRRMIGAVKQGGCVAPRVVSLEAGIAKAEGWLSRRR